MDSDLAMRDPLSRLKTIPWLILLQNAALSVLAATALDLVLLQALSWLPRNGIAGLLPLLQLLFVALPFLAGFGIGGLALKLMERIFSQVYLDTATLWGMVPCLALALGLKGLLPIPGLIVGLSYPQVVGVVLGIFLTGKRHWRY